jgi:hypothetical protein
VSLAAAESENHAQAWVSPAERAETKLDGASFCDGRARPAQDDGRNLSADLSEVEVFSDEMSQGVEELAFVGGQHRGIRAGEVDGPFDCRVVLSFDIELKIEASRLEVVTQEVDYVGLVLEVFVQFSLRADAWFYPWEGAEYGIALR